MFEQAAEVTRALSIRQPWAELIMLGVKKFESRSRLTKIRGRVYVYASLGRYTRKDEAELADQYDLDLDALPRGVIVGTVELYDCEYDEWQLREPIRADELKKPTRQPMPVWFRPW